MTSKRWCWRLLLLIVVVSIGYYYHSYCYQCGRGREDSIYRRYERGRVCGMLMVWECGKDVVGIPLFLSVGVNEHGKAVIGGIWWVKGVVGLGRLIAVVVWSN